MTILKYAKIDLLRLRQMTLMLLLFPVLAVFINVRSPGDSFVFSFSYCTFMGIVIASIPFQRETSQEAGFLSMLPSRKGDDVRGHFLFGFLSVCVGFATACVALGISVLISPAVRRSVAENGPDVRPILLLFAAALLLTGIQNLMLSFFRFNSSRGMAILRLAPAFLFFFGAGYLSDSAWFADMLKFLSSHVVCAAVFLISLVLYAGAAHLGVRHSVKRR